MLNIRVHGKSYLVFILVLNLTLNLPKLKISRASVFLKLKYVSDSSNVFFTFGFSNILKVIVKNKR